MLALLAGVASVKAAQMSLNISSLPQISPDDAAGDMEGLSLTGKYKRT